MTDSLTIAPKHLECFAIDILKAAGVSADEAQIIAASLVAANLRGHDSHGVVRVAEYLTQMNNGELAPGVDLEIVAETPVALAADARFGFGQVQSARLIDRLLPKAEQMGIGCGTMRNCGHVGRLGEWVERVARAGFAGLLSVNDNGVLTCVAPPGGIEPRISTNPIAVGVPTGGEPLVLDISTSAVANGKIRVAQVAGRACPPGWLQDAEGNPTTDPNSRFADPPGTILPMGGEEGYKGFGLGLLFDILVGGLSGGWCPPADKSAKLTNNVLLVVWNPERFAGASHFQQEADKLIAYVRSAQRKPGVDAIRLPGDRSNDLFRVRSRSGVPLDAGTWSRLKRVAEKLSVPVPDIV